MRLMNDDFWRPPSDDAGSLEDWAKHSNHVAMLARAWCGILIEVWMEWMEGSCEASSELAPALPAGAFQCPRSRRDSSIDLTSASKEGISWRRAIMTAKGNSHFAEADRRKYFSYWGRPIESLADAEGAAKGDKDKKVEVKARAVNVGLELAAPALLRHAQRQ